MSSQLRRMLPRLPANMIHMEILVSPRASVNCLRALKAVMKTREKTTVR